MNITTYNCSFINGTHFNSTEPCYDDNYTTYLQTLIFMFFTFGILCFICCPSNRQHNSISIPFRHRQRIIVQEIEPNYSDFIVSLDDQLIEESVCVICYEELEEGIGKLEKCEHKFHKECIKTWLKEKPICPVCRTDIY